MSIDGARDLADIDADAWTSLAQQTGYSTRFTHSATSSMIERTALEAEQLAASPPHDNGSVNRILAEIRRRSRL
jgi:hypothetical protein